MKRLVRKSRFGWSRLPVFVSGMILGAVVALSSPGFSAGEDGVRNSFASTLYALAELAVDTETAKHGHADGHTGYDDQHCD